MVHRIVRQTVKPKAPNAVFFAQFARQRVSRGHGGQIGVKRGVENRDLPHVVAQNVARGLNPTQGARVVQRREM